MRPEVTGKKILSLKERFGVTVAIAAEFSGVSKSSIYEMLASGDLAGRVIAGRMIVEVQGPQGLYCTCVARHRPPSVKRKRRRRNLLPRNHFWSPGARRCAPWRHQARQRSGPRL